MRRGIKVLRWVVAGVLCLVAVNAAWADLVAKASAVKRRVETTTVTTATSVGGGITGTLAGGTTAALTVTAGGAGYVVGDVLSIGGPVPAQGATCRVQTAPGGAVATVVLVNSGTGYAATPGHATVNLVGAGAGCVVTINNVTAPAIATHSPDVAGGWISAEELGGAPWPALGDQGVGAAGNPMSVSNIDQNAGFTHRSRGTAVITGPPGAGKMELSVDVKGEGSSAGRGLSASLLPPDTAYAGIGLYSGPRDSMLIVNVTRSGSNVGLSLPTTSALQVRAASLSHEQPRVTFKMIVYENDAAATADPTQAGIGAKFYGVVILDGSAGTLTCRGGFAQSDWLLYNNGAGKLTARPAPGGPLVKNVSVADANAAMVVLVGDPAIVQATPGVSPAILILLSIVLAATGMVALRMRGGPRLA